MTSTLSRQAEVATQKLLVLNDDQLYAELGKRLRALRLDQAAGAQFDVAPDAALEAQGIAEDFASFGRAFFEKFNVQTYRLVCGAESEELQERDDLLSAFGIGKDAVAPALAAVLVAHLGLAPAIAAVLAAIAIRLFFKPGYQAMCDTWKAKLPKTGEQ